VDVLALSAYPNPGKGEINISFNILENTNGYLGIYDLSGRLVQTMADGILLQGHHNYRWYSASPGIYLVKLIAGQNVEVIKIIVNK